MNAGQLDYQLFNSGKLSVRVKFNYANRTMRNMKDSSIPDVKMSANLLMPGKE